MYRGQTTPLHVQRSALQSQLGTRPAGDFGDTNFFFFFFKSSVYYTGRVGDTNHHLTSENVVVISRA